MEKAGITQREADRRERGEDRGREEGRRGRENRRV